MFVPLRTKSTIWCSDILEFLVPSWLNQYNAPPHSPWLKPINHPSATFSAACGPRKCSALGVNFGPSVEVILSLVASSAQTVCPSSKTRHSCLELLARDSQRIKSAEFACSGQRISVHFETTRSWAR